MLAQVFAFLNLWDVLETLVKIQIEKNAKYESTVSDLFLTTDFTSLVAHSSWQISSSLSHQPTRHRHYYLMCGETRGQTEGGRERWRKGVMKPWMCFSPVALMLRAGNNSPQHTHRHEGTNECTCTDTQSNTSDSLFVPLCVSCHPFRPVQRRYIDVWNRVTLTSLMCMSVSRVGGGWWSTLTEHPWITIMAHHTLFFKIKHFHKTWNE